MWRSSSGATASRARCRPTGSRSLLRISGDESRDHRGPRATGERWSRSSLACAGVGAAAAETARRGRLVSIVLAAGHRDRARRAGSRRDRPRDGGGGAPRRGDGPRAPPRERDGADRARRLCDDAGVDPGRGRTRSSRAAAPGPSPACGSASRPRRASRTGSASRSWRCRRSTRSRGARVAREGVVGVVGDAMRGEVYPARYLCDGGDGEAPRRRIPASRPRRRSPSAGRARPTAPIALAGNGLAKYGTCSRAALGDRASCCARGRVGARRRPGCSPPPRGPRGGAGRRRLVRPGRGAAHLHPSVRRGGGRGRARGRSGGPTPDSGVAGPGPEAERVARRDTGGVA